MTNPIAIFNTSEYENITFDIGLILRYTDIIVNMECLLWKPKEDNCLAICDIEKEPLIEESSYFTINSIVPYKNKKIKFYSKKIIDAQGPNVPFIYSEKQTVDLNDEKDFYYFNFKTGAIQEVNLNLQKENTEELYNSRFDKCEIKQRDMICKISKRRIETFFTL